MHVSQADKIINRFGGISAMARRTGFPKSTVQRWKSSGCIHPRHNERIINGARASNIDLHVADFATADPTMATLVQDQPALPAEPNVVLAGCTEQVDLLSVELPDRSVPSADVAGAAGLAEPVEPT